MGRVLIVFNSPLQSDHEDWNSLMGGEKSKDINGDIIYVFQYNDYYDDDDWDYTKIVAQVEAIRFSHTDSECAVLLHTQNQEELNILRDKIKHHDVTIQRFSTARSPINYTKYIYSFRSATGQEGLNQRFNALWDQIQEKSPDTLTNLITLSILCQGYLAAHGGNGLDGWDKLSSELKEKASRNWENLEKTWWDVIDLKQAEKELADRDEDEKIKNLLDKISLSAVDVSTVEAAYPVIKKILINK